MSSFPRIPEPEGSCRADLGSVDRNDGWKARSKGEPKVTLPDLRAKKDRREKITAITAYDFPSGLIADRGGMDVILVGDSLANTALGYDNTLPTTVLEMTVALKAVRRAVQRALLVVDMPYGSYHVDAVTTLEAAIEFVKAGAEAVKLEGGRKRIDVIRRLVESDIPVMGHIGLTPQSLHALGGYRVQGKKPEEAEQLFDDAVRLEKAGVFALVLEGIPWTLAETITERLSIPTIGIGAGIHCDGQILVFSDVLGLLPGKAPKFVRRYFDFHEQAVAAIETYRHDIRSGTFPTVDESYGAPAATRVTSR